MKNFRKAAFSTICMLMVAVLSLTGATYAWFTAGEQATVNGMNVEITTTQGGIEVREVLASGNSAWGTLLDLNVEAKAVKPLSSKDGVNFFDVSFNPADFGQIATSAVTRDTNENVIVKKIQLRNTGREEITVNLVDSAISQAKNLTSGLTNDIHNAARVALIVGEKTFILGSVAGDKAYAIKGATAADQYVAVSAATDVTEECATAVLDACEIKVPGSETGEGTPVDVTIVIWLEGQDTDCKNANAGGAFDVVLNFKKVAPQGTQG